MPSKRNSSISPIDFGELRSDVKNLTNNFERFINYTKETNKKISEDLERHQRTIADDLRLYHAETTKKMEQHDKDDDERFGPLLGLPKRVEAVEVVAMDYTSKKTLGFGVLAGIGMATGIAGASVKDWIVTHLLGLGS